MVPKANQRSKQSDGLLFDWLLGEGFDQRFFSLIEIDNLEKPE